jgi:trehalose synthase
MKHFLEVQLDIKDFKEYSQFKYGHYDEVSELAKKIGRIHIVHVNTALASGGVAEILKCQVPLERSLGMSSRWLVMQGSTEFFSVTKKIHNLLQGKEGEIDEGERRIYLEHDKEAAAEFVAYINELPYPKVVVLHDPQPLPMIAALPDDVPVISRLHIDITNINKSVGELLKPFVEKAEKIVVSDKKFIADWIPKEKALISFPAIDPFNDKNKPLAKEEAHEVLIKMGIDPKKPIVSQVSRFDPWKDPWGVIKAFQLAKKEIPDLQLILAGLIVAEDDPEAQGIYNDLRAEHGANPDIHLYGGKTPPIQISNDEFINAIQTGSHVVLQKSLREGFGLTVTEALWKGQPVIGGNVGGIKHQIVDGENGFLVSSPEECAERIVELISDPRRREEMGKRAKETVEKEFLMSRLVLDFIRIYKDLVIDTSFGKVFH